MKPQNTKILNKTIESLAVTHKSINDYERFFKLYFSDESKNLSIDYGSLIKSNNSELSVLPENEIDSILCTFNSKYGKGSC
jgi:Ca2+-binding EF-hand superfamily protein